jgi:hypothetical protein
MFTFLSPGLRQNFPSSDGRYPFLRVLGVGALVVGSVTAIGAIAGSPSAQAASLSFTATTDSPWSSGENAGQNPSAVTVAGSTVTAGVKSVRVSFTTGSFTAVAGNQFTVGPCPSWLTATIGGTAANCYISGAMVSLSLPGDAAIASGSAVSLVYAANSMQSSTMNRTVTIGTYNGSHFDTTAIDSGTTTLSWPETVTFNANGGSGTMSPQTSSAAQALNTNTFTRAGFVFGGWAAFNGGPQTYADGATYPFTSSTTLWARWLATVTFDANGGTGTMAPQVDIGYKQLNANTFTRVGYTFGGWADSADSPYAPYSDQGFYNITASVTLYAFWTAASTTTTSTSTSTTSTTVVAATSTTSPSGTVPSGGGSAPAPSAENATTTTTKPVGMGDSELISELRQEQLTAPAGEAKLLVGGELVSASITQASDDLRESSPSERTPEQVSELQNLAASMVAQMQSSMGGATPSVSVRNTATGALIFGLMNDPVTGQPIGVPVESVVVATGGGLVLMAAGLDGQRPARIGLDGTLEIPEGGFVSVVAGGLDPGANGEVVVMSTPRVIGEFVVSSSGMVSEMAALPSDLATGNHTVVVTVGNEAASLGFRVVGKSGVQTLPSTGLEDIALIMWSFALLSSGVALLAIDRRRRRV